MTYYALCLTICLSALMITFAALALVCWIAERMLAHARSCRAEARSRAILVCRVVPVALSLAAVCLVVLPSYLRWEPAATRETVGWQLLWLSAMALLSIGIAGGRVWRAASSTRNVQRTWAQQATRLHDLAGVYQLPGAGGLVATVGIVRPRIFVSADVVAALTEEELRAALAHERAHIQSCDNLKQALLHALRLPFSAGDGAWTAGTEIEADSRALWAGASAVDLSSALVKVARLKRVVRCDSCVATCLIPPGQESALADRVRRLNDVLTSGSTPPLRRRFRLAMPCAVAIALLAMASQPAILRLTHELIERLV